MIKVAMCGFPILGGGLTHYLNIKRSCSHMAMVGLGRIDNNLILDGVNFYHLGPNLNGREDQKELAYLLKEFLEEGEYNVFIPNNSPVAISVIPHLKEDIKVIQFVNSNTERVYKYVTTHIDYLSRLVCISPVQVEALKRMSSNVDSEIIELIPHGVDIINKECMLDKKNKYIKIGFLGRLHNGHKGIFLIPKILSKLSIDFTFEFVGDGEDRDEFVARLQEEGINFTELGAIPNHDIGNTISNWDILLFPSVIEGFGLVLIECMAYEVVPIANLIKGVTDYIIDDGKNGYIIKNNNIDDYCYRIEELARNRRLLKKLQINTYNKVKNDFNLDEVVMRYSEIFEEAVYDTDLTRPNPIGMEQWVRYVEYKPKLLLRLRNRLRGFIALHLEC